MAVLVLTSPSLYADELDLACFASQVTVDVQADELDATTFCTGGYRAPVAGLRSVTWSASGPADFATATASAKSAADEVLAVDIGTLYTLSAVPAGATVGNVGYFTQGRLFNRTIIEGGAGELATHAVTFMGGTQLVRGVLEVDETITANGDSPGIQLGAVSSTQRIWAALHVLTVGGTSTPTLTVKIQSDDNDTFSSATDRITFTAATAKGAQFSSALGAVADDYWRAIWTVSGTSPSFQARVLIGIQ
jgi:hypothetical protein